MPTASPPAMARAATRALARSVVIPFLFALFCAGTAAAQSSQGVAEQERADALRLATTLYYEGVPYAEAAVVTAEGAEALIALLDDPDEGRFHAQTLLILGIAGHAGAYEAIEAYAAAAPTGELEAHELAGCRTAPLAMGHLASRDDRALSWLAARALAAVVDPGFHRGTLGGEQLGGVLRDAAVRGLGMSGRQEAAQVLDELASRAEARGTAFGQRVREATSLGDEVRVGGARRAFSGAFDTHSDGGASH